MLEVPLLPCTPTVEGKDADSAQNRRTRKREWEREELEHVGVLGDGKFKVHREERDGKRFSREIKQPSIQGHRDREAGTYGHRKAARQGAGC